MADLKSVVESLGFRDVRTLLNSGNIVFTLPVSRHADPAVRIEEGLERYLGLKSRVTVLTAGEMAAALDANPLARIADNPSRFLISVLSDPADAEKLKPLLERDWSPEALALGPRVVYLWHPAGIIRSPLGDAVGRLLKDRTTARNLATMERLREMLEKI
jgi:uncharacterized protein (DUF1697 family)